MGLDNVQVVSIVCGDGMRKFEECDDANTKDGDGCSADCKIEEGYRCYSTLAGKDKCEKLKCGDGVVSGDEECDDGNEKSDDGCSKTCEVEESFFCITEPVPCLNKCIPEIGQDVLYPGPSFCVPVYEKKPFIHPNFCTKANPESELWDMLPAATNVAASGCGAAPAKPKTLHSEPQVSGILMVYQGATAKAVCPGPELRSAKLAQVACFEMGFATGTITGERAWDDKGCETTGRDSWDNGFVCGADDLAVKECSTCPATCAKAVTVKCEYSGICGDGFRRHSSIEECDDGNMEDGDGCSSSCKIEKGWLCDGGSWNSADSCIFPVCGDMKREGPEDCDDGNLEAGDGCSPTCETEEGYWCDVSPPEKPDICYAKGDIRLQKYTVVQDKWPLVVTGKLQVMGDGWGSVCAEGFDQKDGMKACEAIGQKMEQIPFYLQKHGESVPVPKHDMRAGTPECPCVNESPTLSPFRYPANSKAKDCPFEFGATSREECVPWLLSQVEGVEDPDDDKIYGSYCAAWDVVATGTCYDAKKGEPKKDAPSWCLDSWCYVDPNNCEGPAKDGATASMFFPETKLFYNYATCVDPVPEVKFEGGCCKKGHPEEGLFFECPKEDKDDDDDDDKKDDKDDKDEKDEKDDKKKAVSPELSTCATCDEAVVLTCGSHP
jgi:cysteine-rich repeat protein